MSHFVKYECKIKNEEELVRSLKSLGFGISKDAVIVDWGKREKHVTAAILLNEESVKNVTGVDNKFVKGKNYPLGYSVKNDEVFLESDWFMLPFSEKQFNNKLKVENTKHLVHDAVQDAGFIVDKDFFVNNDNKLELHATVFR